jgi:hypothetical protein
MQNFSFLTMNFKYKNLDKSSTTKNFLDLLMKFKKKSFLRFEKLKIHVLIL